MFNAKKEARMANAGETVIAQGVRVEGDFHSQGDVVIDGEVAGSVQTSSALRVGDAARIHADVKAANAVIAGEIQGNLFVSGMLELLATSKVIGDITTKQISVAAGAELNGRISMGESSATQATDSEA